MRVLQNQTFSLLRKGEQAARLSGTLTIVSPFLKRLFYSGKIMSLSKKLRFEIFKRDGFKCAYCGKAPPNATLEVDHINPKSKGGKNDINNLITACFDCNRGKRDIPLSKIPNSINTNLEILKEQQSQLVAYNKYLEQLNAYKTIAAEEIENIYDQYYPKLVFPLEIAEVAIFKFLDYLPKQVIKDAMRKTCVMGKPMSYFCGICWNMIKKR